MMAGPILLGLRLLLLIALYLLLAAVLIGLLRDVWQQSIRLSSRTTPSLTLVARSKNDQAPLSFRRSQITLGRNPGCDCVINEETISAVHARFAFHQGHWWLEDLNSTNGTFINEQRVTTPVVLTANDLLRFGEIEYQISWKPTDE
jgi:FHA domain